MGKFEAEEESVSRKRETVLKLVWLSCLLSVFDRSALLGKVLRVDVDNNDDGAPYSIPSDNPFLWEKDARPGKSLKMFCSCEII